MNIVKLRDIIMPNECTFAEFFNKNLKGKLKSAYGYIWMNAVINGFTIDINKLKKVA